MAGAEQLLDGDELTLIAESLAGQFDLVNGGFPGAPKFPPAMVCEFLLRHYERTRDDDVLDVVSLTLDRMARGGIYDQLGGGFARYSVDSRWHVPHFEKMLDDNALLLSIYSHHARLTGSCSVRPGCAADRRLRGRGVGERGRGFAASLDADTGGVEGATYLWDRDQFQQALGDVDGGRAATLFGLDLSDHDPELGGAVLRLPDRPGRRRMVRRNSAAFARGAGAPSATRPRRHRGAAEQRIWRSGRWPMPALRSAGRTGWPRRRGQRPTSSKSIG